MGRPPVIPADKKTRIVLSVLSGEVTIAEAARKEKVSEQSIGRWKTDFLEGLTARWSPEQISRRLIRDYSQDLTMRACPETIYQAVYGASQQALPRVE